ncbi:MAG: sporulation protein YqfD [Firmicutes bacterium]|jgi:similar to stage IV sporulation protein|nr:sporulation protein YqfD [Bacillota bacterium]
MVGAGLWDWLRGYVIIRVEGRAPERFVNMAAAYRVELADVTMLGPGMMLVRTSVDGYRQLGPVLRASGCRAAIEERVGAAFIVARLLRRRFLVLGAVLFLAVLYGSSSVLWTIEVAGAESPEREQILQVLQAMGVRRWTFRHRVDCDAIRREITRSLLQLAWVGVELRGTMLTVRVAPKVAPEIPEGPVDIAASADAVIARLILLAGDAVVHEGDTVVRGQIMVVGRAGPSAGDSPVHARALVQGRVWRAGQARIPLTIEQRIRTGRTADQYVLRLARAELRLGRTGRFEAYDSEQFCRTLVSGRDDGSLVEVIRIRRHELHVELIRLSREQAYSAAHDLALSAAMSQVPGEARVIRLSEEVSDESLEPRAVDVRIVVETLEEIGVPQARKSASLPAG